MQSKIISNPQSKIRNPKSDVLRILILEDVPTDAELVEHELRKEGFIFESRIVETRESFLEQLAAFVPDIVLSDYMMPQFTGMEALELIKAHYPDIPLVIVTGSMNEETAAECMKQGASDYVIKEHLVRLGPAVSGALEGEKIRQENNRAEEAIRNSARQWRMTFDAVSDAILLLDENMRILRCNTAMRDFIERPFDDIIGQHCWRLVHGTTEPFKECPAMRARETLQKETLELEAGDRWLQVSAEPILDKKSGNFSGAVHIISDITDRKKHEEALFESRERYRDLYENAPNAYFSVSAVDGSISGCNSRAEQLFGYDRATLMGMKVIDLYSDTSFDKPLAQQVFKRFKSGEQIRDVELQVKHKDGHPVWVSLSVNPIKDSEGRIVESRSVLIDISERKSLENQLRHAQKMESIGTLAGGIAHDFNNILSVIIGNAELAMDEVSKDHALYTELDEISRAGNRAKDLVKQILTFSRQTDEEFMPIKPYLLFKEALKLLHSILPATIEINQHIDPDSGMIMADPSQMHQVIMNLCTNSYQALSEEGGVLDVRLEAFELPPEFASRYPDLSPGSYVRFTVSDTGCGMTPDVKGKIFDPYFTTKEKGRGTGLGLAVVFGIVKACGGAITVYSEPGEGTTFHVYFPRIEMAEEALEPQVEEPLPTGHERILLVDDEPSVAKSAKITLERLGYKVETQTSSLETLALFKAGPDQFDLVITDLTMPRLTGDKLARELIKIRPDISVILCTGFSEKISEEKAKETGIRAFLMKPVLRDDLAKTVREVLDRQIEY